MQDSVSGDEAADCFPSFPSESNDVKQGRLSRASIQSVETWLLMELHEEEPLL